MEEALLQKSDLSAPERVVVTVEALERAVNSGGYLEFFDYEAEHVPAIVDALATIGCSTVAEITAEAIAVLALPSEYTSDDVSAAASEIYEAEDERKTELDRLDQRFYEYPDPIADRLFAYIGARRDAIILPRPEPSGPSLAKVVGTAAVQRAADAIQPRTGILLIADTLVDVGNVAVDGGFISTPGGWRCRMRDPLDFGLLKTMFTFGANIVMSESEDTILDTGSGYGIEGPGAPRGTTA